MIKADKQNRSNSCLLWGIVLAASLVLLVFSFVSAQNKANTGAELRQKADAYLTFADMMLVR